MSGVRSVVAQFEQRIGSSNATALKTEYTNLIRPAYARRYGGSTVPAELTIDESDPSFNGFGSPGLVCVAMGVANHPNGWLRTFAVAHETGHAVAFIQTLRVGVLSLTRLATMLASRADGRSDRHAGVDGESSGRGGGDSGEPGVALPRSGTGGPLHPFGHDRVQFIRNFYYGQPFGQLIAAPANAPFSSVVPRFSSERAGRRVHKQTGNWQRSDTMFTHAVQYLEDGPGARTIALDHAIRKLRAASERLPISMVLLGWNVTQAVRGACAEETARTGATLYRWHPLLTGDGVFFPRDEWRAVSLSGQPIRGFRDMPEFTFVCPNRPGVGEGVLEHLHKCIEGADYGGVFLDRIRYPSAAGDPEERLGCFCEGCERAAEDAGFDLPLARERIRQSLKSPERFVRALFRGEDEPLEPMLRFRANSVARIVRQAVSLIHTAGLCVGLDCFSPCLTGAVGQDLALLNSDCDWVKIMTYGHTNAPAGIPFEVASAVRWLVSRGVSENQALTCVAESAGISVPATCAELLAQGLPSVALGAEVKRARRTGVQKVLAGIELVEIEGVTRLSREQVQADLSAFRAAGADGLVLSWDLSHIPLAYLDVLRLENLNALAPDRQS